jgi:hypothetical protein
LNDLASLTPQAFQTFDQLISTRWQPPNSTFAAFLPLMNGGVGKISTFASVTQNRYFIKFDDQHITQQGAFQAKLSLT